MVLTIESKLTWKSVDLVVLACELRKQVLPDQLVFKWQVVLLAGTTHADTCSPGKERKQCSPTCTLMSKQQAVLLFRRKTAGWVALFELYLLTADK